MLKKIAVVLALLALILLASLPALAQQAQPTPQAQTTPQVEVSLIMPEVLDRAEAALNEQRYDDAVRDFTLFLYLNPTISPAYLGRAQSYVGLQDFDHALQDLDQALVKVDVLSPAFGAQVYLLRGSLYAQQQQPDAALADFSAAIALSPSFQTWAARGVFYVQTRQYPQALSDLDQALALDATNPVLFIYRGMVNIALRDSEAAGGDYLNFFRLTVENPVNDLALRSGQAATVHIEQGTVHQMPFTARRGQTVTVLATAISGDVDPLIVLLDTSGQALTGDDDSAGNGNAVILNYTVPADGQYLLLVGHALGGFSGDVSVRLEVIDGS